MKVLTPRHAGLIYEEWKRKRRPMEDFETVIESFDDFLDSGNRTNNQDIVNGLLENDEAMKFTFMTFFAGRLTARYSI